MKTSSVATAKAPAAVDYKVVVTNNKNAGAAFRGLLTDTLYNPKGAVMSNRSWDLETIVPGDQITLTYTVEYAASTSPGTYHNVARVTAKRNSSSASASDMTPVEASRDVSITSNTTNTSNGLVLGVSTSTTSTSTPITEIPSLPKFEASSITVAPSSCVPLLSSFMRQGQSNDSTQVMKLQSFLNSQGARLPVTGFFGSMTTAAVKNFQVKYKSEILAPLGLTRPTGNVYGSTQRKINQLNCGGDPAPVHTTTSVQTVAPAPTSVQTAAAAAPTSASVTSRPAPKKTSAPVISKAPAAPKSKLLNTVGSLFKKLW